MVIDPPVYAPRTCSDECDTAIILAANNRTQSFIDARRAHEINKMMSNANLPDEVRRGRLKFDALSRLYRETRQTGGVEPDRYDEILDIVRSYVDSKNSGGILYLYGDRGTGKTWLLQCAVARSIELHARRAVFSTHEDILAAVKDSFNTDSNLLSEHTVMETFTECALLGLDDLGRRAAATEWELTTLLRVIDERYRCNRLMIISSNYDLTALAHLWGAAGAVHAHTAKLICDRLSDAKKVLHIKMAGRSLRREK